MRYTNTRMLIDEVLSNSNKYSASAFYVAMFADECEALMTQARMIFKDRDITKWSLQSLKTLTDEFSARFELLEEDIQSDSRVGKYLLRDRDDRASEQGTGLLPSNSERTVRLRQEHEHIKGLRKKSEQGPVLCSDGVGGCPEERYSSDWLKLFFVIILILILIGALHQRA